jgi:L-alanine-DL-glutamate epimerase-like enolase superfamily enzyme
MRITDIETIMLRLPEVRPNGDGLQDLLVIRVHTDEGLVGIGEVHTAPLVARAVIDAPISQLTVQGFRQLLIGRDPRRINELWHLMYDHSTTFGRRGIVVNVISGIDIALWDLLGKSLGVPIHQLLGGAAMKFGWGGLGRDVREDARWIAAVRDAVGPDVALMLDMGEPAPFDQALWLARALADSDVAFLEEPLSPDDLDGFRDLVAISPTPIATGEKETTRFGFRDLMERGGLRIIQPDMARVGGVTEMLRIAALAEVRDVRVIPHCWASDILVSVTCQFLATRQDAPYLEFNVMDNPLRTRTAGSHSRTLATERRSTTDL